MFKKPLIFCSSRLTEHADGSVLQVFLVSCSPGQGPTLTLLLMLNIILLLCFSGCTVLYMPGNSVRVTVEDFSRILSSVLHPKLNCHEIV